MARRRWCALLGMLALTAVACEPNYEPARTEMMKGAALVCAPPTARPAHGKKTREVSAADLDAALLRLCGPDETLAEESYAVVREALAEGTTVVGRARRSHSILTAPPLDPTTLDPTDAKKQASGPRRCDPGGPALPKKILDSAIVLQGAGRTSDALDRCADVVALSREALLAGGMIDAMFATSGLERATQTCQKLVDAATPELAHAHASVLAGLRSGFPSDLGDLVARDRAEMILWTLGPLRDKTKAMPCERAALLASRSDETKLTRGQKLGLIESWRAASADNRGTEKYRETYEQALRKLDELIARAKAR